MLAVLSWIRVGPLSPPAGCRHACQSVSPCSLGLLPELDYLRHLAADANSGGTAESRGKVACGPPRITCRGTGVGTRRREPVAEHVATLAPRVVFVVRAQYPSDHHNSATMFQTGEINASKFRGPGAIKVLDVASGAVATLLEVPEGVARDLEVSFDGQRILFSMRRDREDDYHLYEMNADGTELRQLTFGSGVSDIDPIYLPDGRIVFTSTREPKYCMCNRHIMGNLFTMDADGANIQQIGHSTLHEGHAALMPDGRVLYDRWEYVDRNFGDAQGVWTVNPDGTNHAVYWGNNTNSPGAVLDARVIPGTENMLSHVFVLPRPAVGCLGHRRPPIGHRRAVAGDPHLAAGCHRPGRQGELRHLQTRIAEVRGSLPVVGRYFLCSRMLCSGMTGEGEQMGIYLIDVRQRILLHAEAPGCFDPHAARPRARPPAIPPRIDLSNPEGHFYVSDVYAGTGMEQIRAEAPSSPSASWSRRKSDSGRRPAGTAARGPRRRAWPGTISTTSGSWAPPRWKPTAARTSPCRPTRSSTSSCWTSRHDGPVDAQRHDRASRRDRRDASAATRVVAVRFPRATNSLAMLRGPARLEPWYGPPRLFSYTAEVQPVLDQHCVQCHDYGKEAGSKLNLAGDRGWVFNTSYAELREQVVGQGSGRRTVADAGAVKLGIARQSPGSVPSGRPWR